MRAKTLLTLFFCSLLSLSAEGGVKQRGMGCSDIAVALDSFSAAKNPALTTGRMRYECNVFSQESVYFDRDALVLGEAAVSLPITRRTACAFGVVSLGTLACPETAWEVDMSNVQLTLVSPSTEVASAKLFFALSHRITPDHSLGIAFSHYGSNWKEKEILEEGELFYKEHEQVFMGFGVSLGYWGRLSSRLSLGFSADSGALFDYRRSKKESDRVVLANPEIRVGMGYQMTDNTLCAISFSQSIPRGRDASLLQDIRETNLLLGVEQRLSSWFVLRGGYRLTIAGRVPTLEYNRQTDRACADANSLETKLQSTFSVGASCRIRRGVELSLFAAVASAFNAGFQCGYVF